jgi:hypothetical protein
MNIEAEEKKEVTFSKGERQRIASWKTSFDRSWDILSQAVLGASCSKL